MAASEDVGEAGAHCVCCVGIVVWFVDWGFFFMVMIFLGGGEVRC